MAKIKEWKEQYPYAYMKETPGLKIKPQTLIREIAEQSQKYGKEVDCYYWCGPAPNVGCPAFHVDPSSHIHHFWGLGTMGLVCLLPLVAQGGSSRCHGH